MMNQMPDKEILLMNELLKGSLSLLDDIRQEVVSNKENTAKLTDQNDELIDLNKQILSALQSLTKK